MGDLQTPIVGGHAYCRTSHTDVDVSVCVACDRMRAISELTSPPYVVCAIDELELAAPDAHFIEWWHQHHRRAR